MDPKNLKNLFWLRLLPVNVLALSLKYEAPDPPGKTAVRLVVSNCLLDRVGTNMLAPRLVSYQPRMLIHSLIGCATVWGCLFKSFENGSLAFGVASDTLV